MHLRILNLALAIFGLKAYRFPFKTVAIDHDDIIIERSAATCYVNYMSGTMTFRNRVERYSTPQEYVDLVNKDRKVRGWTLLDAQGDEWASLGEG